MSLKELKQYLRVDYTDDDSMIELMHDAVIDEMKELIPSFDPEKPTNRQKILKKKVNKQKKRPKKSGLFCFYSLPENQNNFRTDCEA